MKLIRPTAITDGGGSFSRASVGTFRDSTGAVQTAAINTPRVNYVYNTTKSAWLLDDILIEPTRTNILLNSATLSTQSVTVAANTYTLSFFGTGTITLSGTFSGVLVGTHANTRSTLTFTPTAGTVTVTVTGSVTNANLELGTFATSWITTTSSSATRSEDVCTGSGLIYSNVAETDHPAWVSGTTYTLGQRVIRTTATTHSIYERVVAGAGTTAPESDAVNWLRVGPTNRWAAYDDSPSTLTTNTEIITYILKPGRINSVALLELEGTEVAIGITLDGEKQFYGYTDLLTNENVGNWYQYFYEPFYYQTSLALTDLVNAAILDLPQYSNAVLTITIRKSAGTPKVGVIACGVSYELGKTQNGLNVGINDYSRKDVDTFGNTVLVRRKYSKRVRATFFLYSSKVDVVSNLLSQYRATPVVWIAADAQYSALVVYGFYRDWDIGIPNNIGSTCNIEIEGLT